MLMENLKHIMVGHINKYLNRRIMKPFMVLDNIKQKWGADDTDQKIFNTFYQKDLLYLYDRITLDMNYLKENQERNDAWLEKLLELKYEIRNLF